ncbi:MAG: ATP synthase F0 subunit B [Candidatus Avigastranaerophilus sp.]
MEFDATFIIAAISFIVFVFIMNAILYKPVLKIMQARQSYVEENFNNAKIADSETEKQTVYRNSELEKSRNQAQNMVAEKSGELKSEHSKKISEYKEESYSNIEKERNSLKQSALDAKEILKDRVVDIAKDISSKILGNAVNTDIIDKSQIKEQEQNG